MIRAHWSRPPQRPAKGCLILLHGRDGSAEEICDLYRRHSGLEHTTLIGLSPRREWYPAPNGPGDQRAAVAGAEAMRRALSEKIKKVARRQPVAVAGFSAGAVMAVQLGLHEEFAGVVAHSGAVFEPDKVVARSGTPFLLIHDRRDECFRWDERYVPMRDALKGAGYYVQTCEKSVPGHSHALASHDIGLAGVFLAFRLGY